MNIQELATAVLEELPHDSPASSTTRNLGNGAAVAEAVLRQALRDDVPAVRRFVLREADAARWNVPKSTPDLVKLAESYGARGIRVIN